ncbi:hypothetical protein BOTBODRAFT_45410 [Botryobasidium botryosum FD-172 SS1]|uniref:Uncharacterized protein n=1 Tax=Botryobasidium botryosum (strain FD-172 SS1) TaxID=930990 RepID=A0A067MBW0_BOTB1|nr:hypothetical protein BOTBODRAFT_45410 [Botryobasidium botryosum FD-172 SS1]
MAATRSTAQGKSSDTGSNTKPSAKATKPKPKAKQAKPNPKGKGKGKKPAAKKRKKSASPESEIEPNQESKDSEDEPAPKKAKKSQEKRAQNATESDNGGDEDADSTLSSEETGSKEYDEDEDDDEDLRSEIPKFVAPKKVAQVLSIEDSDGEVEISSAAPSKKGRVADSSDGKVGGAARVAKKQCTPSASALAKMAAERPQFPISKSSAADFTPVVPPIIVASAFIPAVSARVAPEGAGYIGLWGVELAGVQQAYVGLSETHVSPT